MSVWFWRVAEVGLIWWRAPTYTIFDAARDSCRTVLSIDCIRCYPSIGNGHQHTNEILHVGESEASLLSNPVTEIFQMIWQGKS